MSTVGIDHIAMPTADAERLMGFYKKLGFAINDEDEWRAGTANIFSIQVGDSKINVHPEGYLADYRGPTRYPDARISASFGTARWRTARRCWPTPGWKSSVAPGRARGHGSAVFCPPSACTRGTRTTTCWSG